MQLQTIVNIPHSKIEIHPADRILFVGSCFADNIGQIFRDNLFDTVVNPYEVMYNPVSILHTVEKCISEGVFNEKEIDVAVFTLGTNHVYILNETGEIVDNCCKRPQHLFTEKILSIEECALNLATAIKKLRECNPETKVILTVSPIRYAKYGFHHSQLSKATLLLAADQIVKDICYGVKTEYFPAYEIMNDELRDYRFYKPDMLHPSAQGVEYIFERFKETYFSKEAIKFIEEWKPIRQALQHRPFNPNSEEYKKFIATTKQKEADFKRKWACR